MAHALTPSRLHLGGLIVLALFINGWPIDKVLPTFETLAARSFGQAAPSDRTTRLAAALRSMSSVLPQRARQLATQASALLSLLTWLRTGARYSSAPIEASLKQVFGEARSMLDVGPAAESGTRVVIPVATVDGECELLTNYSTDGPCCERDVSKRACTPDGSLKVWEV